MTMNPTETTEPDAASSMEGGPVPLRPVPLRPVHLALGLSTGLIVAVFLLLAGPAVREGMLRLTPPPPPSDAVALDRLVRESRATEQRLQRLHRQQAALLPDRPYLVVNTSDNRFMLAAGGRLLREGVCSTGSYVLLKGEGDRQWMFATPRGAFRIQNKREKPVWSKPDWAFVEAGLPIPPPGAPERYERGALGDYALGIGNGYLIHGTLYQRMLGLPVTHGCVRLGDDDLKAVYQALALGAQVYIY